MQAYFTESQINDWCPRRDSNPEPTDYESAALTVELQGHILKVLSAWGKSLLKSSSRGKCSPQIMQDHVGEDTQITPITQLAKSDRLCPLPLICVIGVIRGLPLPGRYRWRSCQNRVI